MISIAAAMSAPFEDFANGVRRAGAFAVAAGVRAGGEGMLTEMRQQIGQTLGERASGILGLKVFPKEGPSLGAAAVVYARGGGKGDAILSAHAAGATIVAAHGVALAIPTENVPLISGGGRGAPRRMTPVEVEAAFNKELRLVQGGHMRLKRAVGLLVLDVDLGTVQRRNVGRRPFGGDKHALARAARRGGARQSLVMFILVRQVRLKKVLDPQPIAQRWADRIPDLIDLATPES